VHPQQWQDVDYQDKKVIIIGSGATAVTLLPALLDETEGQTASQVTM
jgi:cation diffusion facilitator CzcD-associated flavoprotein CzcO